MSDQINVNLTGAQVTAIWRALRGSRLPGDLDQFTALSRELMRAWTNRSTANPHAPATFDTYRKVRS